MCNRHCFISLMLALAITPSFAQTQYPLVIENCGYKHTYLQAPKAVVSIGQDVTETLYQLGLWDSIVGTGVWYNDIAPQFSQLDKSVPRLSDNTPTLAATLAKKPDFIGAQYELYVGKKGIIGSREVFLSHGAASYVLPTDCANKDNTVGADGTRLSLFSTTALYQGIIELADIFDKQERGAWFVEYLKKREAQAIKRAKKHHVNKISAVFWYSSAQLEGPAYVAGQKGAAGYIMNVLGIENIVRSNEEWPIVDWVSISRANPSIIVLAKMQRRRSAADDYKNKIAFLKSNPYTRNMTAVKENRFVIMDASAMLGTTRLFDGLEQMTIALEALSDHQKGTTP